MRDRMGYLLGTAGDGRLQAFAFFLQRNFQALLSGESTTRRPLRGRG